MAESTGFPKETVCFLMRDNQMLLAEKTRGKGKGCLNGYGGRVQTEKGERVLAATLRELREESGVLASPKNLQQIAVVYPYINGELQCMVIFFKVRIWLGKPEETEEMINPNWFPIADLPWEKMMAGDRLWLPFVLGGKNVVAEIPYSNKERTKVIEKEVRIWTPSFFLPKY